MRDREDHGLRPPPQSLPLVLACLSSVYFFWGSTYFAIRIALESLPPLLLAGTRALAAGALLLVWSHRNRLPHATRREALHASLLGVLLIAGGNGLVTVAEQWVSSALAAAVVASGAVWVVLILALLGERPGRVEGVGVLVGLLGVVLLNLEGEMRASPAGALALLVATLAWSVGSVLSRRLPLPVGARNVALEMLAGGVVLTTAGLWLGERVSVEAVSTRAVAAWLYLLVAGSLIGFSAFSWLIRNVRPALATSFAYVNPVVALAIGVGVGGEKVGDAGLAGVAICIFGVALVTLGRRRS